MMRDAPASSVLVESHGRPVGIITERDIAQRVTFKLDENTPAERIMSPALQFIHDDDYLFHGIATMRRLNLRHLPVVDRGGRLCGMLHLHETLAEALSRLVGLIDRLTHEETLDGLKLVKQAQIEVVEALLQEQVAAPEIQSLLTHINNDIYRRIIALIRRTLHEEGWGEPPVEFDLIVMGSGGRGESFLTSDQDNGFILADYSDRSHGAVDAYFTELATRMSSLLHEVGIPRCKGHVMAQNPLWRKSLPQWKRQTDYWLARPNAMVLRLADIYFDFHHVYGNPDLAGALRRHVTASAKRHHHFLIRMQQAQQEHGVALGLFGRLAGAEQSGPERGLLNLKYQGLLPLVETMRLLALREGIPDTSTYERIASLHERGVLNRDERDYLTDALTHITGLVLAQQVRDYRAGRSMGAFIDPQRLSAHARDLLVTGLQAISALRERTQRDFTAEI